ncbi:MAG: electron transfer flavoprotein subunit beta/FixA family protein [Proteobacteria bacterium]|nr:electron transfer flavoprotein subunit beta/FixA family protein [Pseudomonadota bacterium]
MHIIVTVKQVPDTHEVRIDPKTNSLIREGVPSIVNPEDRNAVEEALSLREKHGGTVTVITMGPPQAEEALIEVLAMGADRAVLLTDRAFAGADTLVTAFTLSQAIRKLEPCQLILCGRQAIDGDTAQVGPQLAGFLNLPQVTYAAGLMLKDNVLTVERSLEDCIEKVRVNLPALVTVTAEINQPRYPSLFNVQDACGGKQLTIWRAKDLAVPHEMLGLSASPTWVKKIFTPEQEKKGTVIPGSEKEMVKILLEKLKELNFIQ